MTKEYAHLPMRNRQRFDKVVIETIPRYKHRGDCSVEDTDSNYTKLEGNPIK